MDRRRFLISAAAMTGAAALGPAAGRVWAGARTSGGGAGINAIPNVPVVTHEGRKVHFYEDLIKDRVVTLNVMYANCEEACPLQTHNLSRFQRLLGERCGRDIFMYSITLQPEHDSAKVLHKYVEEHRIGPGWQLLTGKPEDIETLRIALGFYDPNPALDAIDSEHTGILRFGNDRLQRWTGCPAMARPQGIVKAIFSSMAVPGGAYVAQRPAHEQQHTGEPHHGHHH